MSHSCHAMNCDVSCKPAMLMHGKHWAMVPRKLQRELYAAYRPGQERRADPSATYLRAAAACVEAVALKEGYTLDEIHAHYAYAGYISWAEGLEVTP